MPTPTGRSSVPCGSNPTRLQFYKGCRRCQLKFTFPRFSPEETCGCRCSDPDFCGPESVPVPIHEFAPREIGGLAGCAFLFMVYRNHLWSVSICLFHMPHRRCRALLYWT